LAYEYKLNLVTWRLIKQLMPWPRFLDEPLPPPFIIPPFHTLQGLMMLAAMGGIIVSSPAHPVMLAVSGWTLVAVMAAPMLCDMYDATTDAFLRVQPRLPDIQIAMAQM